MGLQFDRRATLYLVTEIPGSYRYTGTQRAPGSPTATQIQNLRRYVNAMAATATTPAQQQAVLKAAAEVTDLQARAQADSQQVGTVEADVLTLQCGRDGFRCTFKVTRTSEKNPNPITVAVYNLGPETREGLSRKGARPKLLLDVGYAEGVARLCIGDVRATAHTLAKPDWQTEFQAGDGERAIQWAHLSSSFARGTTYGQVVAACAAALGLGQGNLPEHRATLDAAGNYAAGYVAHGPASAELDRVLASLGWTWSIQDEDLVLAPPSPAGGQIVDDIGPDTGLLGSPSFARPDGKRGARVKFRALLRPALRPGVVVNLRSLAHTGAVRVVKVDHAGDTHGDDWTSEIEARPA